MRLAWRNLLHDRVRFGVTVVGIAFAVFLMMFMVSLLLGFVKAASAVIDATDVDFWVTARGVPCFDFPAPLPERFRDRALSVPGVAQVYRLASTLTRWQSPKDGSRTTIIIIGADPGVGPRFPRGLNLPGPAGAAMPESVAVDQSNLDDLGLTQVPDEVQISNMRARAGRIVTGFSSFLAIPYVFATYQDAMRYAGLGPEETAFLLCRVKPGHDVREVQAALRQRLVDADVWTTSEFSRRARIFWVLETGAGSAILTGGVLGFIVGMVIVSQTTYATTMENIEEFATLKAMGASNNYLRLVVLVQALVAGVMGYVVGVLASFPGLALLRQAISWVYTPIWLPPSMLLMSLTMCALASLVSIKEALRVEPARVFRA